MYNYFQIMSRKQIREFGTHEFRTFPLVDMAPLPDIGVKPYSEHAWSSGKDLGTRIKDLKKPLVCSKTGKSYAFYDNYAAHTKTLGKLHGPKLDFNEYTGAHDGWRFCFRDNLKLHNQVLALERKQAQEVRARAGLTAQPYYEVPALDKFHKKKFEQSVPLKPFKKDKYPPENYDDLLALHEPVEKKLKASHSGWTHSEESETWFLDDKTPSIHDEWADFYADCYKGKIVIPKFYPQVTA